MLHLAIRGVRFNVGRYVATLVAIITGVAFFAASGFLSQRVIDALEGDAGRQYAAVDVAVIPDDSSSSADQDFAAALKVDGKVADEIRALPDVEAVGGELTGAVAFLGQDGKPVAANATGRLWIDDEDLNPVDVTKGRGPEAADEIAVDEDTAKDEGIEVGDRETLLSLAGQNEVTVVGITSFGNAASQDPGGTVSLPEASAFDLLNSGQEEYSALYVRGSGSQADLTEAVAKVLPDGFVAQSGQDFIDDQKAQAGGIGNALKTGLQAFALLALFVGGFVIYNTFNVIVAQRIRELAVLSAIGATPKQLKRSLRLEGLLIGFLGSVLGVVVGFGLAFLLIAVLEAFGIALPGSGITPDVPTIVQALIAGTFITFLSVTVPARRAAKVEPIEALRDAAVDQRQVSKVRVAVILVLTVLALVGLASGNPWQVLAGSVELFLAVILSGPLIAIGGSRVLRPVLGRLGLEGRLAVDNVGRNPKRTATTANALLIGLFLVTFVTVAGTSIKDYAQAAIKATTGADYVIASTGGTIDPELVSSIEAVDDVERVVPFRSEPVTIDDRPSAVSTGDFDAIEDVAAIDVSAGSFDDLGPDQIIVTEDPGGAGPKVGDTVVLATSSGDTRKLEVVGLLTSSLDTTYTGSFVDDGTFDEVVGDKAPTIAFIDVKSGAQSDVEDQIQEIVDLRPDVTLTAGDFFAELIGTVFNFIINAVNGLLMMSVIVALIGIVNTLSLSILERRRELGLLRIVGMTDRRVQRMVRLESVIISALGTVTGVALGAFVGIAVVLSIGRTSDASISLSIPWLQVGGVLVLGIVLGFLASYVPSRRSTRLDVLDAINAT